MWKEKKKKYIMIPIFKPIVQLSLLFLLTASPSFAQDNAAKINESWVSLKTQIQRRYDIVTNLINTVSKSPEIDKKQLNNLKGFNIDLFKFVDTLHVDSISMAHAMSKNNQLVQALARVLVTTERDAKLMSNQNFQDLRVQLEGIENRIAVEKQAYNSTCKEYKRTDLCFNTGPVKRAAAVRF